MKLRMGGKKRYFFKSVGFRSIQSEIAVTFSCLILITALFIALISYSLWSDSVENNSRDYTLQLIGQVNTNIESYVSYMENISQMVVDNYDVNDYLTRPGFASSKEEQDLELKISGQFDSILNVRKDISNIIIFGSNGRVVLNKNILKLNPYVRPQDQRWYKDAIRADGNPVVSSSHVQNIVQGDYRWVVSLSRELKSPDGTKDLGVLLVDLNYSVINDICSKVNLGRRGYIFIVDGLGNIIYHPQQQLIYSNLKTEMIDQVMKTKSSYFITNEGNDSRMYTVANSEPTGWKIVGVAYINELEANKLIMQTYYILGTFGLVILAILMSLIISSRISKPIKLLELSMKEVERGNFEKKVDVQSSNEIGELGKAFNIMTAEIKELMHQIVHEQELKRKSELRALQSQINPHFLYNTLDSIIWMGESKKFEEVVLMVSSLAKLFRLGINKGEDTTSVYNEIEHVKSYLTIQKMRYKDKIDFRVDVDSGIFHYKVLKIILQPLAENSIYHGIKNMDGIGTITVTGRKTNDGILLQVIDNGLGMTPDEVATIFEKSGESNSGSGVGVKNVNERIKLYFGNEYGLSFESAPGKGTTASILLPVIE